MCFERHLILVTLTLAFIPCILWNHTNLAVRAVEPSERKAISFGQSKLKHLSL